MVNAPKSIALILVPLLALIACTSDSGPTVQPSAPTPVAPTATSTPVPPKPTPIPATPTPVPSVPVVAVVIEPPAVILNIGETQRFTYTAFGEDGKEVTGVLASWSVDPQIGVIDTHGLFTPGAKAGLHIGAVELQVVSGTSRATHTVNVDIVADPLVTIEVGPEPINLPEGGALQLTAKGYDRHGNEIRGLEVLWRTTPGVEIDAQGVLRRASGGTTEGLVGWWRGEGNTLDSAGSNHGTVVNGLDYVPGVVGTAFKLDGVSQYIRVPPAPALNITGDVTVSLWAKRTVFSDVRVRLIHKGAAVVDGVDSPTAYGLLFAAGNIATVEFEDSGGINEYLSSSIATDGEFHQHAFVRMGNTQTLFFDGEIVASASFTRQVGDTAGLPLVIGNFHWVPEDTGWVFGGLIDEVRVYDRALLDAEVRRLFEIESPEGHQVTVQATYKNSVRTATVDVNPMADSTTNPPPATKQAPLPVGTFYEFPDEITDLLARLPVPDGLRLYVHPQGCPSQNYPVGLSQFWGLECINTGGTSRPNTANYVDFTREVLLRISPSEYASLYGTDRMIKMFAHEICHAHQHRMIIDAGLSDPGLQQPPAQHLFELTPEGEAYFAAAGWQRDGPEEYSGGAVDESDGWVIPDWAIHFPHEDFAEVCGLWYSNRDLLKTTAPHRYLFAQEWLGQWVQ